MDVSIIIPVYNAESYLRECLDSALAQTIGEKEILCIDDGSMDHSIYILREYAEKYKEVRIVSQENNGSGMARNKGLELAQGEFVCFLDADDYYLDVTALEQMVQACRTNNRKICGSFRRVEYAKSGIIEDLELHRGLCNGAPSGVALNYADYQDDYHYQSYIFDLKMIRENGILFPNYRRYQDPPFFVKAMLAAEKIWVLPVELYCYRFGHQDGKVQGKFIGHTLMGIRDNMRIAGENGLYELQRKLIARVNEEFYWHVTENFTKESLELLCEIESYIMDRSLSVVYLTEILKYYELQSSYYIMRMLIETKYKGLTLDEYLLSIGAENIAIFGLGTFGCALYSELRYSGIKVICGIDRKAKHIKGLKTISDIENLSGCDAIIVTPLKDGPDIAREIKQKTEVPVYTLVEILNKIEATHSIKVE